MQALSIMVEVSHPQRLTGQVGVGEAASKELPSGW
jgi:hypothetical protein